MFRLLLIILTAFPLFSFSQWSNNPDSNNIVSNTINVENSPVMVSDGAGGSILVFLQGDNGDIYAQKITSSGAIAWGSTDNPVPVCTDTLPQYGVFALADGLGGAFMAWSDYRNNANLADVYLQHIDANGQPLWQENGIRVTTTNTRDEFNVTLCRDNVGGVIVSWTWNEGSNIQVNAQRFNISGVALWTANGVQACTATGFRAGASIVADGNNGVIMFFLDSRNEGGIGNFDIYAQRLNATGARQWTNAGAAVCTAAGFQDGNLFRMAVSDGKGGAIYAFDDGRNMDIDPNDNNIYAQRINTTGLVRWGTNGIPVTQNSGNQNIDFIIPDSSGGFVAAWKDAGNGRLYSQRIDSTGNQQWDMNGSVLYAGTMEAYSTRISSDNAGSFIYAFQATDNDFTMVRAQKLDSAGLRMWEPDGTLVANGGFSGSIFRTGMVASDSGTVIIGFDNERDMITGRDIYAAKVFADGSLDSIPANQFISRQDGNWNDPETWRGGVVPTPDGKVFVFHAVNVTADAGCYSLTIRQPAGFLTIKENVNFIIFH